MKHTTTTFILICASLVFSNCKKDEPAASGQIQPAVGITGIKIGQPAQQAIDVYGSVAPSYGGVGGTYTHFLLYLTQGVAVYCEPSSSATFSPTMLVDKINLTTPYSGKTAEGIGIGSTKTAVEAAYGTPVSTSAFFGDTFSNGLRVLYDSGGTVVEEITIE